MKGILRFSIATLIFISIFSCSKDEASEVDPLSEARNYLEAAAVLSNYNLESEAKINIELTAGMNLKTEHKGVHVAIQSIFNTDSGPTVSGTLNVEPFGATEVGSEQMDAYFMNKSYNSDNVLMAKDYTIDYISSNSSYSSFNKDVFMDFDLLVDNNLEFQDGTNLLDKSEGVNLSWSPLEQTGSEVFVAFCAIGEKCFYAKIPDSGNYAFSSDVYSGLASGTSVSILLARGYQDCITNSGKYVCITNFSLASGGVIKVR